MVGIAILLYVGFMAIMVHSLGKSNRDDDNDITPHAQ